MLVEAAAGSLTIDPSADGDGNFAIETGGLILVTQESLLAVTGNALHQ